MHRILFRCLLLAVSGCASDTATLVDDAMQTGDWQAVNARFDAEARRENLRAPSCPAGRSALCVSDSGDLRCRCVEPAAVRHAIGGLLR